MLNHPNLSSWPQYESDEIQAATQTLISGRVNYWTGELGRQFEVAYAKSVGKNFGVALSNGTVALELALRVMGVGPGDEVIVASRSYVASASCVLLVGATPVFADVDIDTGNISAETIAPLVTDKTRAVIPVHVGGLPCNMLAIMTLAKNFNLKVIEDCAQAHGASINGKPVGAWGHAAIFSFCQDKIISTGGEGGMLLLDDEVAYKMAWAYKDIGRSYDAVYNQKHPEGFRWLTESAGSNFRMTEFQAAIGLKQLAKLNNWVKQREKNANVLIQTLMQFNYLDVVKLTDEQESQHAYYRLYAKLKTGTFLEDLTGEKLRNKLINKFVDTGVPCFSGSCAEIYRERLFANMNGALTERLPNASDWADCAFCFLVHHTITTEEINQMALSIKQVLSNFKLSIR